MVGIVRCVQGCVYPQSCQNKKAPPAKAIFKIYFVLYKKSSWNEYVVGFLFIFAEIGTEVL